MLTAVPIHAKTNQRVLCLSPRLSISGSASLYLCLHVSLSPRLSISVSASLYLCWLEKIHIFLHDRWGEWARSTSPAKPHFSFPPCTPRGIIMWDNIIGTYNIKHRKSNCSGQVCSLNGQRCEIFDLFSHLCPKYILLREIFRFHVEIREIRVSA